MKNLSKFAFPVIFSVIIIILAIRYFYWEKRINEKGVYVLSRRTLLLPGGETGASFRYKFLFKKKEYEISFVDPFFKYTKTDTLLYLQILPNDPAESFLPIKEIRVPRCFKIEDMPVEGWKKLPQDTCK